jgi:glucokinase
MSQEGVPAAIAGMKQAVLGLLNSHGLHPDDVAAVGLVTPGPLDLRTGYILTPVNLPAWRNFPIRDQLSQAFGKPVAFSNDATAAGYGEFWVGSGRDYNSLVLLTLGTGVGGGIILDGRTLDGAHDHGSEIGHVPIESGPQARPCGCGQRGHLEAYCSATSVVQRAMESLGDAPTSCLHQQLATGAQLTARLIYEAARADDAFALQIIDRTADYLAIGIVSVAHMIDPEIVVLGGAMDFGGCHSPVGSAFLDRVRRGFRQQTFPVLAEKTVIDFARLGGDAGYIGAAGLARATYDGYTTRIF